MTSIATIPLIVAIAGLLLYLLTKDKYSEVGRWMFIIGLAATLYFGVHL